MLTALKSKDKKLLFSQLKEQFGFSDKLNYSFFVNPHKKLFILNPKVDIDFSKINVNSLGLYFANIEKELRLSIEGSQLIGPSSTKNILEVNETKLNSWISGKDITTKEEFSGFVLIRHGKDFYGSGKYKDGKVLNFIPKERRIKD
jgi:NOL1/NOP2/fmu family ribosome biogenesis protein